MCWPNLLYISNGEAIDSLLQCSCFKGTADKFQIIISSSVVSIVPDKARKWHDVWCWPYHVKLCTFISYTYHIIIVLWSLRPFPQQLEMFSQESHYNNKRNDIFMGRHFWTSPRQLYVQLVGRITVVTDCVDCILPHDELFCYHAAVYKTIWLEMAHKDILIVYNHRLSTP